jgi:hypothetical protein
MGGTAAHRDRGTRARRDPASSRPRPRAGAASRWRRAGNA